ncbi:hypothetical protein [Chryseobacterium jejuense]|uniref:Uncharacterized protein n=1 Tax=Chryseobacterium jejuense TaxID=445960 RepID=A0A2X2XNB6_CHRJE|nr:hypothetical protein [Chryseobacterium jejuense]SDJ10411.1 hypothetical protein SAMN05421542_2656 [Chryseobacterium jejuense]SQB27890.1 Uncharacterised protein [Chryseobacterium jejuense]
MKKLTKHPKSKLGLRNKKNISRRAYYSQFVALFYIRNTNITLERDATEILRMLKELQQLINRSRLVFSTYCSLSQHNLWQSVLEDLSENIKYIRMQFEYILENIIKKNTINASIFWQQNKIYMDELEVSHKKLIQLATQVLPKEERLSWKVTICNFYDEIFSLLIPLIGMCRLELDFIEKHSPKIFNQTTMDIIKDIPKNYTLQEAKEYEHEYLKVLTNYSHEFYRKNNFWNSLLYILSGGIYPLPSKRTLSKRWISRKMKDKLPK